MALNIKNPEIAID